MPDSTGPTKSAFEAFTEAASVRFPKANAPVFRPDMPFGTLVDGDVNIYKPADIITKRGDPSRFLRHLELLLPDPNDRAILLAYMAAVVQYPGVKFQWAPVIQGTEGNGKSLFSRVLRYAVGPKYTFEPKADQIGSNFNAWVEAKLLISIEEVHMRQRLELLDRLKPLITNEWIEVEGKGVDARMARNTANWIFFTNYQDAIIKSRNDRRYAIFFTAQQTADDIVSAGMGGDYFPDIYDWLRADGYAIIADFFRTYQIPDRLNPAIGAHRAPTTSSTEEAIQTSRGPIEQLVEDAIESDAAGFRGGWISSTKLRELLDRNRMNISLRKQADMLRGLGFREHGRAGTPIVQEGGSRPMLWCRGENDPAEPYMIANYLGYLNDQ
jgi:hypothetical protein